MHCKIIKNTAIIKYSNINAFISKWQLYYGVWTNSQSSIVQMVPCALCFKVIVPQTTILIKNEGEQGICMSRSKQ